MGSYFKLHVITPPSPLNWTSPRSLLRNTLWHHILQDQAPIGHFFIEVKSERAFHHGVSHFITGMSRLNANRSTLKVLKEQVGLGTFFYDFPGKLDDGKKAIQEIEWAKRKNRWKSVRVELTDDRAELLFDELHRWIENGSFRHYGGGHQILNGEGSGCAEMGAHFLNLALGLRATPPEWIRSVHAPHSLIGGMGTDKKVGLIQLFREGTSWAGDPATGKCYATPDMELTFDWLQRFSPGVDEVEFNASVVSWSKDPAPRIEFKAGYPKESEATLLEIWNRVKV
jgi:hypothetical protein